MTSPEIKFSSDKTTLTCSLSGSWTTQELARVIPQTANKSETACKEQIFDLKTVEIMDTAGALYFLQYQDKAEANGHKTLLKNVPKHVRQILDTVQEHRIKECPPENAPKGMKKLLTDTGESFYTIMAQGYELISFLGLVLNAFGKQLVNPKRIRWTPLVAQMEQIGIHALPIVGLISFLIGVVLAFQGAGQLERFGAQIFTINLVAVGVLREMGILLTAIIVAGRSGSAFTAQLGTMKVNEEIDAMRTIGLDPIDVLVLPRIFGLILVLPLLTFYADIMGLLGGAAMTMITLDLSLFQYIRYLQDAASLGDFFVGMIKAPIFAFIIALIGCHEGLQVSRSAESVGRQTTRSVVEAIFFVIVLDALLSILFSVMGI
ncbi:MlaE family lipid ABC transporter permease subunit [Kiloniella sp. EL199]|uniref:ABC transporter permease n=1 Tax=Kiloniella sp. EL199 TaxID=2107581 RepID=UPI0020B1248A|nr:MlaE family lipid ABC transporter permease subunit [Kiloniella sp. EL199]